MGRAFEYRKAAKMKRWGNMSRIFPKLARAITMAAKQGVPDPDMNPKLRSAINAAKAQNLPKDNIEAAIKRAQGKDADTLEELVYEGKGPHGVLIVIECATDNSVRTIANIKSYFNKIGGQIVTTGSLDFMFNRKAVFEFKKPDNMDIEELELSLIDGGLEELKESEEKEGYLEAIADYTSFGTMSKAFSQIAIEPESGTLQRIPTSPVEFSDEQIVDIERLLEKIEDDEDVQEVFTNMA